MTLFRGGGKDAAPSVRRSLVLSLAQKYTNFLLILPTIMIVSRILTPAQVGVYSVAAAFVALVHMLRNFGVSDYIVQESNLDDAAIRTAFTVNLCIAWSLAIVLFASSHWIAVFYREPTLRLILQVLCINFLLLPIGSTVSTLLQRAMQFGTLYKIRVGQQAVQSALTVTLATLGFGAMSLAWGSVAGMVTTTLGCLVWGRNYRVKGLGLSRWRAITHFGIQRMLADVVIQVGINAPDFVIGRMLGFSQVGFYSRGYGPINMFRTNVLGAIQSVAFPALARDHRTASNAHVLFLKSLTYITGIAWPVFGFLALMAFPIMRIMFGPQWDTAIPVLQLLAVAAFIGTSLFGFGQLLIVFGRVGLVTLAVTVIKAVSIVALIVSAFYGLYAVAASQIVVAVLTIPFNGWLLCRHSAITPGDIWIALRPSLVVAFAAMVGPGLVYAFMPPSDGTIWMPLMLSAGGACIGWLAGIKTIGHPLWFELENLIQIYRQRRNAQA